MRKLRSCFEFVCMYLALCSWSLGDYLFNYFEALSSKGVFKVFWEKWMQLNICNEMMTNETHLFKVCHSLPRLKNWSDKPILGLKTLKTSEVQFLNFIIIILELTRTLKLNV